MDKGSLAIILFVVMTGLFVIWGDHKDKQINTLRDKIIERINEVDRDYIHDPDFNKDTLLYYNNLSRQILDKLSKENISILKPVTVENWLDPEEINYLQKYRKLE